MATQVRFQEGYAPVVSDGTSPGILRALVTKITNGGTDTDWTLEFPTNLTDIVNIATISHMCGTTKVFIEFIRPETVNVTKQGATVATDVDNFFMFEVKYGTNYTQPVSNDGTGGVWEADCDSARARFSWFKANTNANIRNWLPVHYWLSVTPDNISIIIEGDPSANYNDRLISFGYIGSLKPFNEDVGTVAEGNFGVSFSCDESPFNYLTATELNQYSDNTATGVVDISMIKTYTGFPFQAHQASFTTPDEFVNKKLEGPSAYTAKYHMSPVYVFHGFDGYRGELRNVVATDRSTVVNLDEMVHKYNPTNSTGAPTVQDIYKVFLVNAPQSLFNNSTNVLYAIGILKESSTI
jgi:hypothetical protein